MVIFHSYVKLPEGIQDLPIFSETILLAERVERGWEVVLTVCATFGWQGVAVWLRNAPEASKYQLEQLRTHPVITVIWDFLIFFQIFGSFSRFQLSFSRFNRGNSRAKGWSIRYMWQWHSAGRCRKRLANSESDLWYVWRVLRLIN